MRIETQLFFISLGIGFVFSITLPVIIPNYNLAMIGLPITLVLYHLLKRQFSFIIKQQKVKSV